MMQGALTEWLRIKQPILTERTAVTMFTKPLQLGSIGVPLTMAWVLKGTEIQEGRITSLHSQCHLTSWLGRSEPRIRAILRWGPEL
mmetsp:Transcript_36204/g.83171  ORF Transcript_36204/g.83171 Transcript_36204/m.83171 type:complete len:86 (+) Transcript_36204:1655-1912(+)